MKNIRSHKIKERCFGGSDEQGIYAQYHDNEWSVPVHKDQKLFEMLILEGAQAGLSWETILKKRQGYRESFYNFNVKKVAAMTDKEIKSLESNRNIIRNRLKINSTRSNAISFLKIQDEFGSFDTYLWSFVKNEPVINHWKKHKDIPVKTAISIKLSKDLKDRGMKFVGPTIVYAYMQAIGMVNDHLSTCWKYNS